MSNGGLARIKYFRGQMLTARDFDDQQEYHRNKQKQLLRRFPFGIVGGLNVTCVQKGTEPEDFDGFLIEEGLAIDRAGNEIGVPEGGFKVPVTEFNSEAPYLSLVYTENEALVGDTFCGSNQKNNRIEESFEIKWDVAPNIGDSITVALIELKDQDESGPICDNYLVILEDVSGGPRIRIDAGVVGSDQLADGSVTVNKLGNGAVTEPKIQNDAVTEPKILNGAVTEPKIQNDAVSSDKIRAGAVAESKIADGAVTVGKIADNAVTEGKIVDRAVAERKLSDDVKGKLVPNGPAHNHTGGGGAPIPENGLDAPVRNKLVTGGNNHDHTNGNGALITEDALDQALKDKLNAVSPGHDHSGPLETKIPLNGLSNEVRNRLVTNGDGHTHAGGNDGARISTQGLADNAVTTEKILDQAVTELKLSQEVQDKLNRVAVGRALGATDDSARVPTQGVADNAVTTEKILDQAVTEVKLSREVQDKLNGVVVSRVAGSTLSASETREVSIPGIPPNAIVQVVPTSGALSWTFRMSASGASLDYIIAIKNEQPNDVTEYEIRSITFNNIVT